MYWLHNHQLAQSDKKVINTLIQNLTNGEKSFDIHPTKVKKKEVG